MQFRNGCWMMQEDYQAFTPVEAYFIKKSEKAVLMRYTDLTGKPALPPVWSFGLWLSTSFTTSYDENTVMSFIDGMLERDIPLKVFHFDCFWSAARPILRLCMHPVRQRNQPLPLRYA